MNSRIEDLRAVFRGEIIVPGDDEYDQASTTVAAKGSPVVIVCPSAAEDVAQAIRFAASNQLTVSVRSGGHGQGTSTDGVVIDMVHCSQVELIDEAKHIVRIGSGAKWGDVATELQPYGLAISSGDTKTVGVGGLTLGGGIGLMARQYGLAIDSLVGVTMVTAQGDIIRADADNHTDLFWAVRGGGGSFAVAVAFEFAAQPVDKVYAGVIAYEPENIVGVMKLWRDAMREAPEALMTVLMSFPARSMLAVVFCYALDDEAGAMQTLKPFLQLGKVVSHDVARKDYADALQSPPMPPGMRLVSGDTFVHELSDELLDAIANGNRAVQLRILGGAIHRIDPAATAFAHRSDEALVVFPDFVALDASAEVVHKAQQFDASIAKFSTGMYSNFLNPLTEQGLRASYPPETYDRLASVKRTYDPRGVFGQHFASKSDNPSGG